MKRINEYIGVLILVWATHGCGGGSNEICSNPVEFSNQKDSSTFGYLVGIEESIDPGTEAARLMEKYRDLEVFAVFSVFNGFHANSGVATLERIRCEPTVVSLTYNNAVGAH